MYEIELRPNHLWIEQYEKTATQTIAEGTTAVPHLLDRVASVVCSIPHVFGQEHGYDWALDDSNDWKMSRKGQDLFVVAYRYGGGGNAEFMKALEVVLNHMLG